MSLLPHSMLSPMPNTSVLKSIRLSSYKRRQYIILLYETIYAYQILAILGNPDLV